MKNFFLSLSSMLQLFTTIILAANKEATTLKRCLWQLFCGAILQGVCFILFVPLFIHLTEANYSDTLFYLCLISAVFILLSLLRWFSQDYDYAGHSVRAGDALRRKMGIKLRQIPLQELSKQRSGELGQVLGGSVDEAVGMTLTVLTMLINALLIPVTVAIAAFFFDWRLGLILLLIFPLILPVYLLTQPLLERSKQRLSSANAHLYAELIEYIQGLPALKSANVTSEKKGRLAHAIREVADIQTENLQHETLPNLILSSAVELGVLTVLIIGIAWVVDGSLSIIVLASFSVIIVRFSEQLGLFLVFMSALETVAVAYQKLSSLNNMQPLPILQPEAEPQSYEIEFRDVRFSYADSDELALNDINVKIPHNSMTALVGPSGCGKSTLTRLIMRYADPKQGSITIGGIDIRNITEKQLMSLLSVVFQEVYLFNDTVLNNIRMAKPGASDDEVLHAAQAAKCHEFILQLPAGYETSVGEIGGKLSGGERQRISIARALLKDAPIVILDEPTAALDTESEVGVQQAIDVLVKNKTVIVIAHRLSTIVGAQQILVLNAGELSQQGKHTTLIQQEGRYKSLWQAQQRVKEWRPG